MSHNLYTLNNNGGDVASYHGSSNGFVYIGHGETATYPKAFTHLDVIEYYDTNPINTLGATLHSTYTNWYNGVTVGAGTYYIESAVHLQTSGTNANQRGTAIAIRSAGTIKTAALCSPITQWASTWQTTFPKVDQYVITVTGSTKFDVVWSIISGTTTTDTPIRVSETGYLLIRKLRN